MLSTGSKRKVWLAGALAAHATVTLLDEPEAALDVPSRRALRAELARCNQGGDGVWLVASYSCPIDGDPSQTLSLGS
jgi:ABC-type sulfate/molybdate transport systems ATPase subunit